MSSSVDVSPYRAAWLAFERIAEADGLIDPSTLGPRGEKYLRNRLWRAFAAGWSAAGGDKGSAAAWKDTQAACDESSRAVRSNATTGAGVEPRQHLGANTTPTATRTLEGTNDLTSLPTEKQTRT